MNIIVIGLGSMGKRRIRLLQQYVQEEKKENWIIAGVDTSTERCLEIAQSFNIKTYYSFRDAINDNNFDCAIISTSPLSHSDIILECLNSKLHVFSEINLVDEKYDENMELAKKNKRVLFLSSTFMYRKEVEYIKNYLTQEKKGTYDYHIGQYLPEWHPWESYKQFFVSDRRTNGCREIFAIELPWLTDIFGMPKKIHSIHRKVSNLELDYDDSYCVTIEHSSGVIGNLLVDIVTPKAGRNFKFWNEEKYLEWNGTPDSLQLLDMESKELCNIELYKQTDHQAGYNKFVIENAYYDELANYIQVIENRGSAKYSFEKDKEILEWIDRIEE